MLNLIKNPTPNEFSDWIQAAERETWRHIPRIKSHCAEERTLDLCVQRLRKRVMYESWEARYASSLQLQQPNGNGQETLKRGNPSFFQSPSLVCFSGLGVTDPYESVQSVGEERKDVTPELPAANSWQEMQTTEHVDITSGWGGMGLSGNHSHPNLYRSPSGGSGIFIGEESDGENTYEQGLAKSASVGSWATKIGASDGYIKTSHMANFYYRKDRSNNNLSDEHSMMVDERGPRANAMSAEVPTS